MFVYTDAWSGTTPNFWGAVVIASPSIIPVPPESGKEEAGAEAGDARAGGAETFGTLDPS